MRTVINAALLILLWSGVESAHAQSDFWRQINEPFGFRIQTLAFNSSGHIFAVTGGGIFRSIDKGNNWTPINTGLTPSYIILLAINSTGDLFAGAVDGIFRSTDNGDSWIPIKTGLGNLSVNTIVIDSSGYILVGTTWSSYASGVFRSIDNGDSWQRTTTPDNYIYSFAISPNRHVFAATNCCRNVGLQTGSVFRSLDRGESWKKVYENGDRVSVVTITRSGHIFAVGSIEGLIRSTNDGETWESANTGLERDIISALAINSRGHIFVGTWWSGILRSTDQGESWTAIDTGLMSTAIGVLAIDAEDYVYTGDDSGRVLRSVLPTSVKVTAADIPTAFALAQNYPNPFNPTTAMQFDLPRAGFVTLKVYNTLGEEVASVLAQTLPAGRHQIRWEANGVAAGVYLYRLQAGGLVETKKLLLVK